MSNFNYQTGTGERCRNQAVTNNLPEPVNLVAYRDNPPELPAELIEGILRCGHKMLISGSSKAGKSFLLMELCIALAEGRKWLGFQCRKGKVMYVNLEIDPASCIHRFMGIYSALGIPHDNAKDIVIWNLRGHTIPLDQMVPDIISQVKGRGFSAVVIDPIYKVLTGDENSATDMGAFCNQFDKICDETGCAAIYCHHHSKGAQGAKKAMDRASGSGVFARDPDAQLDLIALTMTDDVKNNPANEGATAWRMESNLREFKNIKPVDMWFRYPLHKVDETGELRGLYAEGNPLGNLSKSSKRTSVTTRRSGLDSAFNVCAEDGVAEISKMADYLGISKKSIARYADEFSDTYKRHNGMVYKVEGGKNAASENGKT